MRIAIATGRGGSAGETLRDALMAKFHPDILVGYYNGAHTRTLDIKHAAFTVPPAAAITEVGKWLDENSDLFVLERKMRRSPVQITIELSGIRDVANFRREFLARFGSTPEGANDAVGAHNRRLSFEYL